MLDKILNKYPRKENYLLEILLEYQRTTQDHAFVETELRKIAEYLNIPESRVCSVVSFYSFFSTEPRGKYIIQVCKDVPCYLSDTFDLAQTLKDNLSIGFGETTKDGLFTLETSSCLGHCDVSPAMRVNQKTYGNLTKRKVKAILAELRGGARNGNEINH